MLDLSVTNQIWWINPPAALGSDWPTRPQFMLLQLSGFSCRFLQSNHCKPLAILAVHKPKRSAHLGDGAITFFVLFLFLHFSKLLQYFPLENKKSPRLLRTHRSGWILFKRLHLCLLLLLLAFSYCFVTCSFFAQKRSCLATLLAFDLLFS